MQQIRAMKERDGNALIGEEGVLRRRKEYVEAEERRK